MKLHPNGSIEGTPEELHQYTKLQEKKEQFKVIPPVRFIPTKDDSVYIITGLDPRNFQKGNLH